MMRYKYNDGGRSNYFAANKVGDCVTRSISIAKGKDYKQVYNEIKKLVGYTPRNGIYKKDTKKVMAHFGGTWVSCSSIGQKQRVHLNTEELPSGRIICQLSKHVTCVINGVINDTYDPSRDGTRLVYGYWKF